ncbi:replication initiator [Streptosporangium sp. NPDC023615]|uniref:replication initiator n=1 Tax=Streptosporangium sp. NPDC023615 TaxID=3154794 RepID=UPI003424745E
MARQLDAPRAHLREVSAPVVCQVAEYQARGLVHFHAVIRLDGPDGPASPAPGRATVPLLDTAIRQAAAQVVVPASKQSPDAPPSVLLRWGDQLDVRPVYLSTDLDGVGDQRVRFSQAERSGRQQTCATSQDISANLWTVRRWPEMGVEPPVDEVSSQDLPRPGTT